MSTIEHLYMPENHMDKLYNSANPMVRYVHRGRLNKIISSLPQKNHLKILDAGCGEGHLIEKMHSANNTHQYFGADITAGALKKARIRCPYATLRQTDLSDMVFDDNYFDVVVCTETIEHIPEYRDVFNEFKRVLRNGGELIITFPNEIPWTIARFFLGRRPIKVSDHINSFYPWTIRQAINLEFVSLKKLPFNLPLFLSLGSIMKFRKN